MRTWKRMSVIGLLLIAGCGNHVPRLDGSRSAGVGTSELVTEYRQTASGRVALLHILFVPDVGAPGKGGFSSGMTNSGKADLYEMRYGYHDPSAGVSIQSRPVTIINAYAVSAGKRSFLLVHGNVFIARVARNGEVELSQVGAVLNDPSVSVSTVLEKIRQSAPADPRIQSLGKSD